MRPTELNVLNALLAHTSRSWVAASALAVAPATTLQTHSAVMTRHAFFESQLKDNTKNKIKELVINGVKVRFQNIRDLPFKDLRKLIDEGKKEIGEGLVIIYAINDNKVGLAVGVTKTLESKFDAVKIVRAGSEIIGGQGGGGRADFAQAGGTQPDKIQESFENIKKLIN